MPSKDELLRSIKPGMKLDKAFFKKIYGYELTWPGFADIALERLKILGCSRAREYYTCIVAEYQYYYDKQMRGVSEWYAEKCEKEIEGKLRREVNEGWRQRKADQELLDLLETKREILKGLLQTQSEK